jgi:hypothetical protein
MKGKRWDGMEWNGDTGSRIDFDFTHRGRLICLLVFLLLDDESLSLWPTVRI